MWSRTDDANSKRLKEHGMLHLTENVQHLHSHQLHRRWRVSAIYIFTELEQI
jgi:hypothetical protein